MFVVTKLHSPSDIDRFSKEILGIFDDIETVEKILKEDSSDFSDCGYYDYIVVEKIEMGLSLFSIDTNPIFYKWNLFCIKEEEKLGNYKKIEETPKFAESIIGWYL